MQLRPVLLLAPECERPPTRRRFVAVTVGFATGLGVGLAAAHRYFAHPAAAVATPPDPRVAWARALASDPARTHELLRHGMAFLAVMQTKAPDDPQLWDGVARIAFALLENGTELSADARRALATSVVAHIRSGRPPRHLRLHQLLESLARVAR
jgi:hypothetical protein